MSETQAPLEAREAEEVIDNPVEHIHTNRRTYIIVAVVLAILTVTEVLLQEVLKHEKTLLAYVLLTGTILKAGLVAAFYMHLKWDSRIYTGVVFLALFLVLYFLWIISFGHLGLVW
jgi:cytochrome c oxidase subunit 4